MSSMLSDPVGMQQAFDKLANEAFIRTDSNNKDFIYANQIIEFLQNLLAIIDKQITIDDVYHFENQTNIKTFSRDKSYFKLVNKERVIDTLNNLTDINLQDKLFELYPDYFNKKINLKSPIKLGKPYSPEKNTSSLERQITNLKAQLTIKDDIIADLKNQLDDINLKYEYLDREITFYKKNSKMKTNKNDASNLDNDFTLIELKNLILEQSKIINSIKSVDKDEIIQKRDLHINPIKKKRNNNTTTNKIPEKMLIISTILILLSLCVLFISTNSNSIIDNFINRYNIASSDYHDDNYIVADDSLSRHAYDRLFDIN